MNVVPATRDPRAARRTSCLGTFLLVLVLWSLSVVALAAYLITRSAIVRQVRVAWWTVFLAAAALLAVEVAIFEATGDGLADLLRLHVHPWWLLLHGYRIGSLITWPMLVFACQAPLGVPVGAMVGALLVARGERLAADPTVLAGVRGRYSAFFRALAGTADGRWGLEDVDLAVLTIPTIASRTDADAAVRLVLEDLGHFATRRKARVGDDVLLVLDEFSAIQGGTDQAIHLAERLRDVGVPVIFGAQSPEGLGDERQQWRLLHTVGGGLVLHQTPNPEPLVGLAGTVRTPEQAWQLDGWGPAGQARIHMEERPRVAPNQVRQLYPGEAFVIQAGRAVKLSVLQAPMPAQVQEEASALRAIALSAAEPVYVAEGIVGAPPQVERWQPPQHVLDQPDEPVPLLALAAPGDHGQATEPVGVPALPATPRPRILLALRRAVAARDEAAVAAVIHTGQREQPDWDPTPELQRLGAVGRWRR